MSLVGSALNFAGTPKAIRSAAPEYNAHTDSILQSLGYSAAEIDALRGKGVI